MLLLQEKDFGWSCSPGCICKAGGSLNKASGAAQQDGLLQEEKGCSGQCKKLWSLAMPRVPFHCSWMAGFTQGVRGELATLFSALEGFHSTLVYLNQGKQLHCKYFMLFVCPAVDSVRLHFWLS